ncbi:hypothetical protein KAR91_38195 [Candidatus Pacearchaeota archaeon]|nr:hypothetical protein [Candidatus Pacearchaeota archaeon]
MEMNQVLEDMYAYVGTDIFTEWIEKTFDKCKFCHRFYDLSNLTELGLHWDTGAMERACDLCLVD